MARHRHAIIRLLFDTGVRLAEVTKLNIENLDLEVIHVMGKGRRPRSVPFGNNPEFLGL